MGIKQLRTDLLRHSLILVDTMVFVYLLESHPTYVSLAEEVLGVIEQGQISGVISTITLTELLTAPAQANDMTAMLDYELYLLHFPHLAIHPLDVKVAREAARVRASTGLPTPDAVLIATAQVVGADALATNDKRWQGKTGKKEVLVLADYVDV